jgi:hypothetical protein
MWPGFPNSKPELTLSDKMLEQNLSSSFPVEKFIVEDGADLNKTDLL